MTKTFYYFFIAIALSLTACNGENRGGDATDDDNGSERETGTWERPVDKYEDPQGKPYVLPDPEEVLPIDYDQDISNLSLQDLRILRNSVYARHGYIFMNADLRGYFSSTMEWYDTLMWNRWEAEEIGMAVPPLELSKKEQGFIDRIKEREEALMKNNFIDIEGVRLANVNNIINRFQLLDVKEEFWNKLQQNGFVIVPDDHIQLFHVYEENDYHQFPNFITTDVFLQLYHMYFVYLLREIEEKHFIPTLKDLTGGMRKESMKLAAQSDNQEVKKTAEFTATYFAIANSLLTGEKVEVPAFYRDQYNKELENVNAAVDDFSEFMDVKEAFFGYSLFKPRGHYSRSDELTRYFKAMMWLQTAPFCSEKQNYLRNATFIAYLLKNGKMSGNSFDELYRRVFDPVTFLIGENDNISIMDIVEYMDSKQISDVNYSFDVKNLEDINVYLIGVKTHRNKIKPKQQLTCSDKINFMPQRYLPDNEVLQETVDTESEVSKRPYPKGLDVMAAFGSEPAGKILLDHYGEDENWDGFMPKMEKLHEKFEDFDGWDKTVYNKWIQSLLALQKEVKDQPWFMQTRQWDLKNLNTALASWAELKHDAILYSEQPSGAECGGWAPPDPVTLGYVEPNVPFWKKSLELMDLTMKMLKTFGLDSKDIIEKSTGLRENAEFLLSVSRKEINGEDLTDQEYKTIEILGSTYEYLTLHLVEPTKFLDDWSLITGPDKSVAVVADIYTANTINNQNKGILHVANGNAHNIYVVVEMKGNLYLTKGAVFSYYEFTRPLNTRLTDEEWQQLLEDNKAPEQPDWLKPVIYEPEKMPRVDEKIFYSSGC